MGERHDQLAAARRRDRRNRAAVSAERGGTGMSGMGRRGQYVIVMFDVMCVDDS